VCYYLTFSLVEILKMASFENLLCVLDFLEFYDFSLSSVWDSVETEVFSRLKNESLLGPLLHHLRPAELAFECPGVRCDGMHYGSDFAEYGCRSSSALWDGFLADFLIRTLPVTRPPMKSLNSALSGNCLSEAHQNNENFVDVTSCGINKTAVLLIGAR